MSEARAELLKTAAAEALERWPADSRATEATRP
jgi:hypothetical protein